MAPPTTSATGRRAARAFTLLETLIVIALAGLVAALAVANLDTLLAPAGRTSPAETLAAAIAAARSAAAESGTPATLEPAADTLRLVSAAGAREFGFSEPASVSFSLPPEAAAGAGRLLNRITFHPSGCATPALIELRRGNTLARLRLEPISGALIPEETP